MYMQKVNRLFQVLLWKGLNFAIVASTHSGVDEKGMSRVLLFVVIIIVITLISIEVQLRRMHKTQVEIVRYLQEKEGTVDEK